MKYLLQVLIGCNLLLLVACQNHDEHYYKEHPKALQEALKQCPKESPLQVNCAALELIALDINKLVYELQQNPQDFGQKIIVLQSETMSLKQSLGTENKAANGVVTQKLHTIDEELAMRLAIVKWLESPES